ncbi:MAG TPA: hypothetical protein VF680_13840 [Allosphingosinicella sp.]|jgi:hypothetical protein
MTALVENESKLSQLDKGLELASAKRLFVNLRGSGRRHRWEVKVEVYRKLSFVVVLTATTALAGCGTPFSGKSTGIDWSGPQGAGTIAVSDPKMYRREALINERNDETEWIGTLLTASKTIDFKPEIAREVELITALSGALGLNFDPASGVNYRRAAETGDLQQEINTMRLQLQLDQLRRDAELVRSKFDAQTEPVNANPGTLGDGTVTPAASITAASAADQLKAAIDRLSTLAGRLDAEGKGPLSSSSFSTANPGDVFRDRSAYRDLLKSARNAASLDELHDYRGTALIRLNFQATVIPDRARAKAPGIVQMKVVAPTFDAEETERVYRGWLNYINSRLNKWTGTGWEPDVELLRSAVADNFGTMEYYYAAAAGGKDPSCAGFALTVSGMPAAGKCKSLIFAIPQFRGTSAQEGAYSSLEQYVGFFDLGESEAEDRRKFQRARELVPAEASKLVTNCGVSWSPPVPQGRAPTPAQELDDYLRQARVRLNGGATLIEIERLARQLLAERNLPPAETGALTTLAARAARARMLISSFEAVAYKDCSPDQMRSAGKLERGLHIPPGFRDLTQGGEERVAIYEIGPREQVQQVSTVARNANSLALALSVAASAPGSGAAASAAAGYSRQAMGRAAALERVPAVVGYAIAAERTFGWVLGPRAALDPRGKLELEQNLRAYDLSVDLSVPASWPWVGIETVTAWAPAIGHIAGARVTRLPDEQEKALVKIPLSKNHADYEEMTKRLATGGLEEWRRATLAGDLNGQAVSACRPATLLIKGERIWRASMALIGGHRLDGTAIRVAPDMSGILLQVPALDDHLGDVGASKVPIRILTPYGDVDGTVDYAPKPAAGCKAPEKKVTADAPTVTAFEPTRFAQGATRIQFTITGTKLDQVSRVTLNAQPGTVKHGNEGKSMQVIFETQQLDGLPVSRTVPLNFYKDQEKVDGKLVEVTAKNGGE